LQAEPEQPLWIVPTLGGDARRVPNVLAHDATWMPDGRRLLIANGNELTIVDADGSDPHKLLTTPGLAFWLRWSPDGKYCASPFATPSAKPPNCGRWRRMAAIPTRCCPAGASRPRSAVEAGPPTARILSSSPGTMAIRDIWALRERPWFLKKTAAPANHQWTAGL
jgi:hypothetical protein